MTIRILSSLRQISDRSKGKLTATSRHASSLNKSAFLLTILHPKSPTRLFVQASQDNTNDLERGSSEKMHLFFCELFFCIKLFSARQNFTPGAKFLLVFLQLALPENTQTKEISVPLANFCLVKNSLNISNTDPTLGGLRQVIP